MSKIKDLVESIADNNILAIKAGETGCELYRIKYKNKDAVIKVGCTDSAREEIVKNVLAYNEMNELGVSSFLAPTILDNGRNGDIVYLILEYAGKNFVEQAQVENTLSMTKSLITALKNAYVASKRYDPTSAKQWLNQRKDDLKRYFTKYLLPAGFACTKDIEIVSKFEPNRIAPQYITWATADLTPDNVLIKDNKIVIIDPKPNAKGIPLIDLAMFATLIGEVYTIPNGKVCAQKIKRFAVEVGELLEIPSKALSRILFKFGEARQYALSSRFRVGKDPRASVFAQEAVAKLEEILESDVYAC